ncbi:MAG: HEAT repeat domain-containing protein [Solirubrobacterales bacterium]
MRGISPPSLPLGLLVGLLLSAPAVGRAAEKPRPVPPPARIEVLGRVLAFEDSRSVGEGELDRLLRDRDRGIRRRAALAAGRIGDPVVVPTLIDLMNDAEPEVRQMAAFALGLIGDKGAIDRLVSSLGDSEVVVRARSAEALGRIGDARAAPELARFILGAIPKGAPILTVRGDDPGSATDPWIELRLALFALGRLKEPKAAAEALLLSGKPRFDWWAATWVAMRVESPALRPVLVAAAASNDPLSRSLAARGLGALKDASAIEILDTLAHDADPTVAFYALRALQATADARATSVAASLLASPNPVVKREALLALAALPPDRSLRRKLVPMVGDKDPWIRSSAFAALARTDREEAALILSGIDPDPVWWVRASLATALGAAGDEISVGILFSMLKDEDVRVLPSVLEALRVARGADAVDTLKRHLEHPDFAVRAAAAEGLAAAKAPGLAGPLAAAYKRGLGDQDLEARLAALRALAAQNDDASRAALREAARDDPSRVVRGRAAAALGDRGDAKAPLPGPEAVRKPPLDYRLAMAPYDPLPDVPLYTPRAFLFTRLGKIEIHLNTVEAPLTVASFLDLARRGFYDGLTFHRVEPGFVVQGGCPRGDGNGGPGYTLRCEIGQRPYGRGAVGMALSGKDTGGSQFFITLSPQPHLDGGYTLFGSVAAGMDVVEKLRPGDVIERVEVWTGG